MNDDELREAIERPARGTGVTFEPGLVDRILRDLGDSANPLPLMQMLLNRLWQDRRQGYITHESYARLGGIHVLSRPPRRPTTSSPRPSAPSASAYFSAWFRPTDFA